MVAASSRPSLGSSSMERFGLSKEVAAAVLYLASDDSRFTSAIDLVVDGGMSQV
jgi:NAD(P)-dependent dehydrogenase (short-subunit alcohol dehydrogenase family)